MIHALHGNLGSPGDWDGLELPELRAVDLWEWQERFPGISLEEFGTAFSKEVAEIDPEPVLLGYSLGGRLALQAMAARPDLWKGAILVSTHPGLIDGGEKAQRRESDRAWARQARDLPWRDFLEAWNDQEVLANQAIPVGQRELEFRREAVARAFESWSLGLQDPMDGTLVAPDFPVLVLTGEEDRKFSRLADRFREWGCRVEMKGIPGAGHRLPLEASEQLSEVIREWLER